jgi:SAM-dependent methyltransferase
MTTLRSALDLAEGFHLACALLALDRHGIISSLARPATAAELARRHFVDRDGLQAALELLATRTDLIARSSAKFRRTSRYDDQARFVIHQYVGAYGPNAAALDRILRMPSLGRRLVDRGRHAEAFEDIPSLSCVLIADLVVQLGFNDVLDLGCGTGLLLADLAGRVAGFRGWGLDGNPAMCTAARARLKATAGAPQVRIFRGDGLPPQSAIPPSVTDRVRTLTAASLANEFFAHGGRVAEQWLARLKRIFPGRVLLIGDYYGQLGRRRPPKSRMLALHDFVQVISGQGVPPPDLASWKRIYRAARCSLVHVVEDDDASFFAHLVKL